MRSTLRVAARRSSPSASSPPSRPPATATSASARPLPPPQGVKSYKTLFHRAEQFVEKPYFDKALEYLNSGQYRWNAGMFIWSFVTITEGLQKHQPEMYAACQRWFKVAASPAKLDKVLAKEYPEIKKISIDYALMEHAAECDRGRRRLRVGRPRLVDGAGAPPQGRPGGQLRRGGLHPRGWRAQHHLRRPRAKTGARPLQWSACATPSWCRPTMPPCWRTRARRRRSRSWSSGWLRIRN